MREDALKTIIEQHALYLNNGNTGKRANLRDANLQGADLRDADLRWADLRWADLQGADLQGADLQWAIGNMREVRSMQVSQYAVTYTATQFFIGCKIGIVGQWAVFGNALLNNDDDDEDEDAICGYVTLWREHKDFIILAITSYPATPAGKEGK